MPSKTSTNAPSVFTDIPVMIGQKKITVSVPVQKQNFHVPIQKKQQVQQVQGLATTPRPILRVQRNPTNPDIHNSHVTIPSSSQPKKVLLVANPLAKPIVNAPRVQNVVLSQFPKPFLISKQPQKPNPTFPKPKATQLFVGVVSKNKKSSPSISLLKTNNNNKSLSKATTNTSNGSQTLLNNDGMPVINAQPKTELPNIFSPLDPDEAQECPIAKSLFTNAGTLRQSRKNMESDEFTSFSNTMNGLNPYSAFDPHVTSPVQPPIKVSAANVAFTINPLVPLATAPASVLEESFKQRKPTKKVVTTKERYRYENEFSHLFVSEKKETLTNKSVKKRKREAEIVSYESPEKFLKKETQNNDASMPRSVEESYGSPPSVPMPSEPLPSSEPKPSEPLPSMPIFQDLELPSMPVFQDLELIPGGGGDENTKDTAKKMIDDVGNGTSQICKKDFLDSSTNNEKVQTFKKRRGSSLAPKIANLFLKEFNPEISPKGKTTTENVTKTLNRTQKSETRKNESDLGLNDILLDMGILPNHRDPPTSSSSSTSWSSSASPGLAVGNNSKKPHEIMERKDQKMIRKLEKENDDLIPLPSFFKSGVRCRDPLNLFGED